ncbi:ABC transporter [Bdellovibrio bacteriovorus]|uniref:ABC transporter n=1 Tax=Bdellovibrio bacteriovorus TaxID=959 RepID=A0A161PRX9_BDEBC|nr:ABC transporter ATP-binding protein [Bdellovibrio bacteriovorus]KYG67988.1 ABC transporter [Bdellovibrio bacteriovorus]
MTKAPLLACRGLTKDYTMGEIQIQALRGINLNFNDSEFVVLLGASGSGKSTLLNILGGLDVPTSGEVVFENKTLSNGTAEELTLFRRENVGFVFQFYNLIPNLTAAENVDLVTDICEDPMTSANALTLVGLKERQFFFPSQLSGGEQQRVAIARAIAKKPKILLCDEPTGALDLQTGKMVLLAIQQVHRELGTLVIVITHNSAIADLADRVLYLGDGKILKERINEKKISIDEVYW